MALLVPNNGEAIVLSYLVNKSSPENLVLKLFTNNITPAETDTTSTYTEATGGGYAAITLTGASWVITQGAPSDASYAQQSFTFTGPLTTNPDVRGYYIIRATTGDLVYAEAFAVFTPAASGDILRVTPKITAD